MPTFHSTHRGYLLCLLSLLNLGICVWAEDAQPELTVAATVVASVVGESVLLECLTSNSANKTRYWILGSTINSTILPFQENASERVYANNTEGTLTFTTTWLNDTDTYTCFDTNGQQVSLQLHIYVMPTYYREGMIIFGIDLGLAVVFIACGLYTFIKSRLKAKKDQQEAIKKTKLHRDSV